MPNRKKPGPKPKYEKIQAKARKQKSYIVPEYLMEYLTSLHNQFTTIHQVATHLDMNYHTLQRISTTGTCSFFSLKKLEKAYNGRNNTREVA